MAARSHVSSQRWMAPKVVRRVHRFVNASSSNGCNGRLRGSPSRVAASKMRRAPSAERAVADPRIESIQRSSARRVCRAVACMPATIASTDFGLREERRGEGNGEPMSGGDGDAAGGDSCTFFCVEGGCRRRGALRGVAGENGTPCFCRYASRRCRSIAACSVRSSSARARQWSNVPPSRCRELKPCKTWASDRRRKRPPACSRHSARCRPTMCRNARVSSSLRCSASTTLYATA